MSSTLSLSNHLKHLVEVHRELDEKITEDYENHVDDTILANEKLTKLSLKREIEELKKEIKIKEQNEH
jgi:hypothetical protein